MSIFDLFKPKTKTEFTDENTPDEEYQLPELTRANFNMTADLRHRYEDELLMKQYGLKPVKYGEFV